MAGLSEDVLRKIVSPNAMALSKPDGVNKILEDRDPNEYSDFDDSIYLAENYNGGSDFTTRELNPERIRNSGVLSAIKNDMVNHPIDTTALNSRLLESADGGNPLNNDRLSKMLAGAKQVDARARELDGNGIPKKQQIRETVNYGGGVDYALIKTIVNECLEAKLSEISNRGVLNEDGRLKGIVLSKGKIKLMDNQGNVFSAKLEYEGKAKEKK